MELKCTYQGHTYIIYQFVFDGDKVVAVSSKVRIIKK